MNSKFFLAVSLVLKKQYQKQIRLISNAIIFLHIALECIYIFIDFTTYFSIKSNFTELLHYSLFHMII